MGNTLTTAAMGNTLTTCIGMNFSEEGPVLSAGATAMGNIITVFPKLLSGRNIPAEGISLETDAEGALKNIRTKVRNELDSRWFDICIGTEQLTNKTASASDLGFKDGATLTIVRTMPSEDQWNIWRNLVQVVDGSERVMLDTENVEKIGWQCLEQALLQTRVCLIIFRDCELGCDGAEILAEVLIANENITRFCIQNTNLGDDGAVVLAQVLNDCRGLRELNLQNTDISDVGVAALAEALATNNTLKVIDIADNSITNDGAIAVAKALTTNQTLEHICLNDNKIQDDGAVEIAKAIEQNTGLTLIAFGNNQFGDVGKNALEQAQAKRVALGKPLDGYFMDF